ncbi:hypothetical protein [Altererythrobacter lauratis]|uniref:Uncharacterized protein n=1 Tax=Alteraurantiacibacter lauratis TaxID=2054627 RepID=A0ABV7EG77_9SPHN
MSRCCILHSAPSWREEKLRAAVWRLIAALLLAVIAMQAVPSTALPIDRTHGSAFSAGTLDVSLAPRQHSGAEQRLAPSPDPVPPPLPALVPEAELAVQPHGIPRAAVFLDHHTPAPPRRWLRVTASSRAPPAA